MSWMEQRLARLLRFGMALVFAATLLYTFLFQQQSAHPVGAQESVGAQVYASRCASCHQAFGQGVTGTFPPLASNPAATDADYVTTVIVEGRTGSLEVAGVVYETPMPAVAGLSDEELTAVVEYVVDVASRTSEPSAPPPVDAAPTGPADPSRGRDLFIGSTRFENGGGACSSCHVAGNVGNLSGPGLGPDLTQVYNTLGGDAGLDAWLTNPPSVTMLPLFADRPLTPAERGDLIAFLADAPSQNRQSGPDRLVLLGLAGSAVLVAGMAVIWSGMRQTYLSRISNPPRARSQP